jgi:hypothetical protein
MYTNTGSFLFLFLGVDALTVIMLPILSVLFHLYLLVID